jgi:hypothetical protein
MWAQVVVCSFRWFAYLMVSWQQLVSFVLDGLPLAIFIVVIWTGPVVLGESFFVIFAVVRCYFVTNLDG